jgi:hypothetical protein
VAIDDRFIDHASQGETRSDAGLSYKDIVSKAGENQGTLSAAKTAVAL